MEGKGGYVKIAICNIRTGLHNISLSFYRGS